MIADFGKYKEGIKQIIKMIVGEVKEGAIVISPFNHKFGEETRFNLSEKQVEQEITSYLDSFKAEGGTNLNAAIVNALQTTAKPERSEDTTLIIFTDGKDTEGTVSDGNVKKYVSKKMLDPKYKILSFGYGSNYDSSFFEDTITANGFQHIHLSKNTELTSLQSHLHNITSKMKLFEVDGRVARLEAGDIVIGKPISDKSTIKLYEDDYVTEYHPGIEDTVTPGFMGQLQGWYNTYWDHH
jgi:hypothetical protein